ncbi:hypothetical protein BC829DRAFT_300829 [Chytridium lagenaria]|nr:hypothetical protein BC829DRAFT_300829 [Chytridium lagenaria]
MVTQACEMGMKVVALLSGGKDSCFNALHCKANGHEIVALANLKPAAKSNKDDLDSFMYQTVGHDAIHFFAGAMNLPLFRRDIEGTSAQVGAEYSPSPEDEVEDLYRLLLDVKTAIPDVQGVSVGAILSNYQRVRVENVCSRLGLVSLAYLWRRDQAELLSEMINYGVDAVFVKVAGAGFKTTHLGKSLAQMYPILTLLNQKFGSHICGEGGEFETLTLNMPLFVKRIVLDEVETVTVSDDPFAAVAYLRIKRAHLEDNDKVDIPESFWEELRRSGRPEEPTLKLNSEVPSISRLSLGKGFGGKGFAIFFQRLTSRRNGRYALFLGGSLISPCLE